MPDKTEQAVSELTSLLRMLQVFPETGSIGKIYMLLLAFCTTWRTFGFQKAYLLLVESNQNVIKGHVAAERAPLPAEGDAPSGSGASFEAMAKTVFNNYEKIESSDLTLKTRSFSVPLDWHRSAVVKAVGGEFPVLAEEKASEFKTDPFFDFFGAESYVAIPIKVKGRVIAVLAVENGATGRKITVEDVSVVYSLAQHAANSIERWIDNADQKRKTRVLRKLQDILRTSALSGKSNESINLALSMICRSSGGSGVFLKDYVRQKTLHIKTVDEFTVEADNTDLSIGESFENILDRAAGLMKPIHGDSGHALLNEIAAESIRYFYAYPLVVAGEGLGALGVYVEKNDINRKHDRFRTGDKMFIELCAGLIADKLYSAQKQDRLSRSEDLLEELRANLVREQETARFGGRAIEHLNSLARDVDVLRELINSRSSYQSRIRKAKEILHGIGVEQNNRNRELAAMKFSLKMTDLFAVVRGVVEEWREKTASLGVDITARVPRRGPVLLMNEEKIRLAIGNILRTMSSCVREGDKVMVECSTNSERAVVAIADTGAGLPGNLLSRLFMPFSDLDHNDEFKSAMSLAGDIFHHHAGEIMIKSSTSWKTILVVSFPTVSNKDRRQSAADRRNRSDRRSPRERKKTEKQSQ